MDNDFGEAYPSTRFRKIDLLVIGTGLVRDLADAFGSGADMLHEFTMRHANYLNDREVFHEQAALEIEALTRRIEE